LPGLLKAILQELNMIITNNNISSRDVTITGMYFQNRKDLKAFPKRMEWAGETYTFRDGLQYLVKKGGDIVRIFDMTDGQANYRLRSDVTQTNWTLLDVTPSI
jgi:hypothetical protein